MVEHLALMARIYDYDPVPVLEQVSCPMLAIWGERDLYVPVAASVERFAAALGRAGNGSFRLEVVPDADHGLRLPPTGEAGRGPRIPDLWTWSSPGCAGPSAHRPRAPVSRPARRSGRE